MATSFYLAIDVGTSRTAAATSRLAPDGSLLTTSFPLGRNSDNVPTSMFVSSSELLFGDAAERRGITDPQRLVREFKRRIGDDIPIVAGDRRFRPEEVFALMVGWVVDTVSAREGRLPSAIAVTVPAAWGEYRTQRVEDALARHGWASVTLVTEPEAAARHYVSTGALPVGRALAVYDLGGGTFDAIVLRRERNGEIRMAGAPTGIENIGGTDFDDAMLRHAIAVGGLDAESLGDERVALAAFRRECVEAKEALSFDAEAVIPLLVGGGGTVRITRSEFEQMIEDQISRTADVLDDAIHASKVKLDDVEAILLTGGSSRIPRVSQLLSERFNRPIAVDADPKAIIAMGAARSLSDRAGVVVAETASADRAFADELDASDAAMSAIAAGALVGVAAASDSAGAPAGGEGSGKKKLRWRYVVPAAAGVVAVALAVAIPAGGTSPHDAGSVVTAARFSSLFPTAPKAEAAAAVSNTAPLDSGAQSKSTGGTAPSTGKSAKKSAPQRSLLAEAQHPQPSGNASMAPSKNYDPAANPPPSGGSSGSNTGSSGSTPSATPSDTPSATPSDTPSATPSDTPSSTPTDTPSATPSDTPSATPSDTPTDTPSATPSDTPSATPSDTPSSTPTDTPSSTPTDTPSSDPSATP